MKDYFIGLDIGTDSVGWAVTDNAYNVLKFKGNAMWGIRLIEESQTAQERRLFRGSRRRVQRDKFRLSCLEEIFNEEISKLDPSFFHRIKESNLWLEDKSEICRYSLFNDKDFNDKDYHKKYPTIYHLRRELIDNKEAHDIRLVYLAIAHIIKKRGHFLFDSASLGDNDTPDFSQVWAQLSAYLLNEFEIQLDCRDTVNVQNILKDKSLSVTAKKEKLAEEFSISKKDVVQYTVLSLLSGATADTSSLFGDEQLKSSEAAKITFRSGYDEKADIYESVLGERFELIERLKAVYDWAVLADVLGDSKYLSYAKCDVYDKHRSDLELLKRYVKKYVPAKYNLIFNENKSGTNNYLAYSGHCTKGSAEKRCSQADFLDFLRKQLPKTAEEGFEKMYEEIALGIFLPKAVSKDNSVIPMQINKAELTAILKNASSYLQFLNFADESGKTAAEKIADIFAFRIPYYVGPLNSHSDKAWIVRKNEKIYPWNFSEIVDVDKSAERFIENLTSKCTYLKREDVLPKNSLLYTKFTVLNELNNLRVNGEKLSVEHKQKIYTELFMKYNKVTEKRVKGFISSLTGMDIKTIELSGVDGDFKSNLKVFRELESFDLTDEQKEEIISAVTVFGEDKKLLRKRLKGFLSGVLGDADINRLCKLKYTGWGRLSRKFLSELTAVCSETGELDSIIGFMWNTNENLMQLLSSDYGFTKAIEEENGKSEFKGLREEVEELYVSPKVKRPIWQTMKIVEEIVKIMGHAPAKIFVEVARGEEEKKRTVSRKKKLEDCYKTCKKDNLELFESLAKWEETDFRRDALYLYYTQMGRCMYTGKVIPLEDIFNKNLYDIDHIYPRSLIKDDSLDNRVLVTKISNEEKTNIYPIKADIRNKQADFWRMLLDKDLITKKKYERLIRNTALTDEELSAFVNRQLVETRQSTKAVAQLLDKRYSSDIIYVKAGLVSEFRDKFDFVKSRDVNDLHHAKDAYLNIVAGNVYDVRCTRNKANFIKGLQSGIYSLNRMYDYDIDNAWSVTGENKSIDIVRKTLSKNNIRFTRYSSKQKGKLFDQNLMKKGGGQVPVKQNSPLSDIQKYGGYNRATSTYFAVVSFTDKKGSTVKAFVPVNLHDEREYLSEPVSYITRELLKLESDARDVHIIVPCVKYNSLISVDGFRMHISSKSSGGRILVCKPAVQLILDADAESYIKKISNYLKKCTELRKEKEITVFDGITEEKNIEIYDSLADKVSFGIFKVKFSNLGRILVTKRDMFIALTASEQCKVIMQLLAILHADVRTGDLELLGEAKKSGATTIGNKIPSDRTFKLIHQSITGLFEKETVLN